MGFLPTLHFALVCVWLGFVLVETVIEFGGREEDDLLIAARLHYQIDLFLELPVVAGVLVTGALLTERMWPLSPLLLSKIAMGLFAIAVNLYCALLVILRYRRRDDPAAVRRLSRSITSTWLGVPFGLGAFYLGLRFAGIA